MSKIKFYKPKEAASAGSFAKEPDIYSSDNWYYPTISTASTSGDDLTAYYYFNTFSQNDYFTNYTNSQIYEVFDEKSGKIIILDARTPHPPKEEPTYFYLIMQDKNGKIQEHFFVALEKEGLQGIYDSLKKIREEHIYDTYDFLYLKQDPVSNAFYFEPNIEIISLKEEFKDFDCSIFRKCYGD